MTQSLFLASFVVFHWHFSLQSIKVCLGVMRMMCTPIKQKTEVVTPMFSMWRETEQQVMECLDKFRNNAMLLCRHLADFSKGAMYRNFHVVLYIVSSENGLLIVY